MKWLLNSAMIAVGGDGDYRYRTINQSQAIEWLKANPDFMSRVGYAETAQMIESLSGVPIPVSRELSQMTTGDEALIIRLKYRLQNPSDKGSVKPSPEEFDFSILSKLA